jgi:hypothetical protein
MPDGLGGDVRGVFDLRVHVTASTETEAWQLVHRFLNRSRVIAPEGVEPRYAQLRPPNRSRTFAATMGPQRARG